MPVDPSILGDPASHKQMSTGGQGFKVGGPNPSGYAVMHGVVVVPHNRGQWESTEAGRTVSSGKKINVIYAGGDMAENVGEIYTQDVSPELSREAFEYASKHATSVHERTLMTLRYIKEKQAGHNPQEVLPVEPDQPVEVTPEPGQEVFRPDVQRSSEATPPISPINGVSPGQFTVQQHPVNFQPAEDPVLAEIRQLKQIIADREALVRTREEYNQMMTKTADHQPTAPQTSAPSNPDDSRLASIEQALEKIMQHVYRPETQVHKPGSDKVIRIGESQPHPYERDKEAKSENPPATPTEPAGEAPASNITDILGQLEIKGLTSEVERPKVRARYDMGDRGVNTTRYHWVIPSGRMLVLVFDTRYDGDMYEPPSSKAPIKMTLSWGDGEEKVIPAVVSQGLTFTFGVFQFTLLLTLGDYDDG